MIKALILIGGKSRRMGFEKSLLRFYGKPQYKHLKELLEGEGLPTYLSVNQQQPFALEGTERVIKDQLPGIGPMGGLIAASESDPHSSWLIVACDMPFINAAAVRYLLDREQEDTITTFRDPEKEFPEVLFTLYPAAMAPELRSAVRQKSYSLQSILKKFPVKEVKPIDPQWLFNVNTEEQLQEALKRIRSNPA